MTKEERKIIKDWKTKFAAKGGRERAKTLSKARMSEIGKLGVAVRIANIEKRKLAEVAL